MKGHVPTPEAVIDGMVSRLFRGAEPSPEDTVIDAGAGDGRFGEGVLRYCKRHGFAPPRVVCVELDPLHARAARARLAEKNGIEVVQADFLLDAMPRARYILGNPPYVGITGLDLRERAAYRRRFKSARGRFDLYMLFFERSLELLTPGGASVSSPPKSTSTWKLPRPSAPRCRVRLMLTPWISLMLRPFLD